MLLKIIKLYGIYGFLRLIRDVVVSKMLISFNCKVVRSPFYIRKDGQISYGRGFTSGVGLRLDVFHGGKVIIGDNVQINDYVHIAAIEKITIGKDTLIASKVFITDHNHGVFAESDHLSSPDIAPSSRPLESKSVAIGDRVWLGENVTILPGAKIGNGVIAAAGSIVRGTVPDNVIIAGAPAKIIKKYNYEIMAWEKI